MRDFTAIVRRNLGRLPLAREREEEIVTELANQMEDAYQAALAAGTPEEQAHETALGQIHDWEKCRREIVSAERGEKMLWPHPNAIPRTVSWCALALVLALCLVPSFRQAVGTSREAWTLAERPFSESRLHGIAEKGLREHDARLVAFAAMHLEDRAEGSRLAEQAVGMDPKLTWIGAWFVLPRHMTDPRVDSRAWIARMEEWDPENAVPHLLAAEMDLRNRVPLEAQGSLYDTEFLKVAATTPWAKEMAAAVAAPGYDDYVERAFELNRNVLGRVKAGSTGSLVWYTARIAGIPDEIGMLEYANLITSRLGPEAEAEKRYGDAERLYQSLVLFARRKENASSFVWGRVSAWQIEKIGYQRLAGLYERNGRGSEAAAMVALARSVQQSGDAARQEWGALGRGQWESGRRAGTIAWIAAWMTLIFGIAALIWAGLLGFRSKERVLGGWAGGMALAVSYAPLLLLASCGMLFGAMWPYLQPVAETSSANAVFTNLAPFWFSFWAGPDSFDAWRTHYIVGQLMWPGLASLAVLILGIAALRRIGRVRRSPVTE